MRDEKKRGVILSYINIILKNLFVFLYTPFLLKYLGQTEFGLYQMTNSVILSLGILSLGLSSSYIRFYTLFNSKKDQKNIDKLNGTYLIFFSFISIISVLIGLLMTSKLQIIFHRNFTSSEIQITKYLMVILTFNISLSFISSVFDSNIIVNEKFIYQQTRQILQTLLVPIITIPLLLYGFKAISIAIVATIVTFIFLLINIRYAINKLNMQFSFQRMERNFLRDLLVFSSFIFLGQIIDLANNNIPNFLVGVFLGPNDVATYSVATQLKNLFFMLSTAVSTMYVPYVNKIVTSAEIDYSDRLENLSNLMINVGKFQLLIITFFFGGFISIGNFFINLWVGPQNKFAYDLVILLVIPTLIPLCQNIGIEIQRALNKHYFRSIVYFIFALINIVITVFSIKIFGLVGSTFGYLITLIIANGIAMNIYYHFKLGLNMVMFWKQMLKASIPFFLSITITLSLQKLFPIVSILHFFIYGFTYVLVYGFVYYLMNIKNLNYKIKRTIL